MKCSPASVSLTAQGSQSAKNTHLSQNIFKKKKSRIRETLNLSTCADSRTDTKTDKNGQRKIRRKNFMTNFTCRVSPVTCHPLHVTCHLSLTPTATATATDPAPANSLCTLGWLAKTQKKPKIFNQNSSKQQTKNLNFVKVCHC